MGKNLLRDLNDLERQAAIILLKSVNRVVSYDYTELSDMLIPSVNPHTILPNIIGNVSLLCFDLGIPLLSAKVVSKDTKKPGDGFFKLYCECFPNAKYRDPIEVWKEELKKIRIWNNWEPLMDYLGIEIEIPISPLVLNSKEESNGSNKANNENVSRRIVKDCSVYPDEVEGDTQLLKDGSVKQVTINQYERNPEARRQCIEYYGSYCSVCGFDFGIKYGTQFSGKVHVHHLKPLSEIKAEYEVNPIKDLRPVCPNCHMILHCKKEGVYTVDEVKKMFIENP